MQLLLTLSVFFVAAAAILPFKNRTFHADFTLPPLNDEQKAAINTAVEKKLSELPQDQQDAAHKLLDTIAKAAEEDPEGFKAAIVKAFNNLPESAKQEMMKLKAL